MPDDLSTPTKDAAPHRVQGRPRWLIVASQSYGEPRWTIYRRRRFLWFGWWEYASYVTSHPESAALIEHLSQPDTVVWGAP